MLGKLKKSRMERVNCCEENTNCNGIHQWKDKMGGVKLWGPIGMRAQSNWMLSFCARPNLLFMPFPAVGTFSNSLMNIYWCYRKKWGKGTCCSLIFNIIYTYYWFCYETLSKSKSEGQLYALQCLQMFANNNSLAIPSVRLAC